MASLIKRLFTSSPKTDKPTPVQRAEVSHIFGNVYPVWTCYKIENGYLLMFGGNVHMGNNSNLYYCANEQEVSERMVTERAKQTMGLSDKVQVQQGSTFRISDGGTFVGSGQVSLTST